MSRSVTQCFAFSSLLCLGVSGMEARPGAEFSKKLPSITVLVYNYAAVAPAELVQAEQEAIRILGHAGVVIEWLDFPLGDPQAKPSLMRRWQQTPESLRLALRILPREMAERFGLGRFAFGFALPAPQGEFAQTANVFYHAAEELAGLRASPRELTFGQKLYQRMAPLAMILGHLMAHEIGHLLLGRNSHSRKGIMSLPWGQVSVRKAALGKLLFTSEQAKRIRAGLRARIRAVQSGRKSRWGRVPSPRDSCAP